MKISDKVKNLRLLNKEIERLGGIDFAEQKLGSLFKKGQLREWMCNPEGLSYATILWIRKVQ